MIFQFNSTSFFTLLFLNSMFDFLLRVLPSNQQIRLYKIFVIINYFVKSHIFTNKKKHINSESVWRAEYILSAKLCWFHPTAASLSLSPPLTLYTAYQWQRTQIKFSFPLSISIIVFNHGHSKLWLFPQVLRNCESFPSSSNNLPTFLPIFHEIFSAFPPPVTPVPRKAD